jgi:hypothetical protein
VSPIFRNYDVVASIYPTLERAAFGRQLDDARNAFLDSPRQERAFRKNSVVAELFVRKRN